MGGVHVTLGGGGASPNNAAPHVHVGGVPGTLGGLRLRGPVRGLGGLRFRGVRLRVSGTGEEGSSLVVGVRECIIGVGEGQHSGGGEGEEGSGG